MGYRSDVRIIVTKNGFNKLRELVRDKAATRGNTHNLIDDADKVLIDCVNQVRICWDNIKWYQGSYDDVDDVMHGLRELSDLGYSWSYARIGEELDDIDENHNPGEIEDEVDWAYITRYFDDEGDGFKEGDNFNV